MTLFLQTKTPVGIAAYWDSKFVGLPSTDRVSEEEFWTWSFFIDIWYFNRVLSIYLGNTACLHVKHTYFNASL